MKHPISAYTRATHTVAKTRQVVMLYDGAIRFLKQAAEAIEANNIEERYMKLTRASDVISGLQNSLDFDSGGQTAHVLFEFYSSVEARIMGLHRQPSAAACQQVVTDLKEMRDVWDGIDRHAEEGSAARAATPPQEAAETPDTPPTGTAPSSVKVSA